MKTWDDYEQGCLDTFGGGHRTDGHLEAFRHGMSTVFNLLRSEFPPAEVCKSAVELQVSVDRQAAILKNINMNTEDAGFLNLDPTREAAEAARKDA